MLSQWQLLYQISPIFLKDGVATGAISGNMLPLLAIINADAFDSVLMGGSPNWTLDEAFGIFQPAPGGSLVEQSIAEYPFANLNVAANAIVRNPINVSLVMLTPMKTPQAWSLKIATMTALKATLDNHNNAGGTYVVFTPAYIYQDMCMTALTDISTAQSPLPQNAWRWDFTRPLVQLRDAYNAESNLMSKITASLPVATDSTGVLTATGMPGSSVNVAIGAGGTAPNLFGFPISTSSLANILSGAS